MEFTEMEKRMLYQTEGSERYAVLQEMSMASRYAGDPARRKAAKSLLEKLCPLNFVCKLPLWILATVGRSTRLSAM